MMIGDRSSNNQEHSNSNNHPDHPFPDTTFNHPAPISAESEQSSQISNQSSAVAVSFDSRPNELPLGSHSQHETSNLLLQALAAKHGIGSRDVVTTRLDSTSAIHSASSHQSDKDEESLHVEQKILVLLRQSLLPFSDRLDPFAQLPTTLNRFQEHLVSFYLLYYPKVTYGLSAKLQPHPVATNFAIAMNMPACFQVALARSALYRLSLQKYGSEKDRAELEIAMFRHKGEAIRMVRQMSLDANTAAEAEQATANNKDGEPILSRPDQDRRRQHNNDALIASIISLGTLDRRTGSEDAASMHFTAVRRLLRAAGGPLAINSILLSRVMVHFECIYGTTTGSYVWEPRDFSNLLRELNVFLAQIWELWLKLSETAFFTSRSSSSPTNATYISTSPTGPAVVTGSTTWGGGTSQPISQSPHSASPKASHPFEAFALPANSSLRASLARSTEVTNQNEEPSPQQRTNLIFQLTCLMTLCHVVTDYLMPTFSHAPISATATKSHKSSQSMSSSTNTTTGTGTGTGTNTASSNTTAPSPTSSHSSSSASSTPISTTDLSLLQGYLTPVLQSIERTNLLHQPCNNHMWLLQVGDQSSQHSRRIWRAASFVWVLRHVGWRVQNMVREWLLAFMTGEMLGDDDDDHEDGRGANNAVEEAEEEAAMNEDGTSRNEQGGVGDGGGVAAVKAKKKSSHRERKPLRLDAFHFSYAS